MWGLSIEGGGKYYFLLIVYEFCSGSDLYSESLSFRMFIFL